VLACGLCCGFDILGGYLLNICEMTKTEQKAEMTKEEFANCVVNLRTSACFMTDGDAKGLHDEVSEQLRSVIRGELIKYNRCLGKIIGHPTDETENIALVDRFLNNKQ